MRFFTHRLFFASVLLIISLPSNILASDTSSLLFMLTDKDSYDFEFAKKWLDRNEPKSTFSFVRNPILERLVDSVPGKAGVTQKKPGIWTVGKEIRFIDICDINGDGVNDSLFSVHLADKYGDGEHCALILFLQGKENIGVHKIFGPILKETNKFGFKRNFKLREVDLFAIEYQWASGPGDIWTEGTELLIFKIEAGSIIKVLGITLKKESAEDASLKWGEFSKVDYNLDKDNNVFKIIVRTTNYKKKLNNELYSRTHKKEYSLIEGEKQSVTYTYTGDKFFQKEE